MVLRGGRPAGLLGALGLLRAPRVGALALGRVVAAGGRLLALAQGPLRGPAALLRALAVVLGRAAALLGRAAAEGRELLVVLAS